MNFFNCCFSCKFDCNINIELLCNCPEEVSVKMLTKLIYILGCPPIPPPSQKILELLVILTFSFAVALLTSFSSLVYFDVYCRISLNIPWKHE